MKFLAVVGVIALPLAACAGSNQAASNGNTVTRAAAGDLSTPGGARRLDGDQAGAIRTAIGDGKARNVILLIGDGMGDSEITIARNYEKGAGGFLAGLDALPLTGQFSTYALGKDGKPAGYDAKQAAIVSVTKDGKYVIEK